MDTLAGKEYYYDYQRTKKKIVMTTKELKGMKRKEIAKGEGTITGYNISDILTALIKAAAMCDRYSSDILYDIEELKENIKNSKHEESKMQYLGIREYGVDSVGFMEQRKDDYKYIDVYVVEYTNNHDNIKVTLYKLS